MHALTFLTCLALATPAVAAGWAQQEARAARPVSPHFSLRSQPLGGDSVVAIRPDGSTGEVHLNGTLPVFGPGEVFAVVEAEPEGGLRDVRLLGTDLRAARAFSIRAERSLVLGTRGLALRAAREHGKGAPFEIEFLARDGSAIGETRFVGRSLLGLEPVVDGDWIAFSGNELGVFEVHRLDAVGRERFVFSSESQLRPVVAAAGTRTAIGVFEDGLASSRLSLLTKDGRVSVAMPVPAFHHAVWSPSESRLALAGERGLTIVDATRGVRELEHVRDGHAVSGNAVAFARDGRSLLALTTGVDELGDARGVVVERWTRTGGGWSLEERTLSQVSSASWSPRAPAAELVVVSLAQRVDGTWDLATNLGRTQIRF